MAIFSYKAISLDGTMVKGFLEAEDAGVIRNDLNSKGLFIIDIRESNRIIGNIQKKFRARGIKKKDVIEFANNLSVMLNAGLPVVTALQDISATTDTPVFKDAISDIKNQIEMGSRFSDALERHKDILPSIFIRLSRIGEETGLLSKSLSDIAGHLQKMLDLSQAINRALMYPIFAIVTTFGALVFWLVYVMPKMMTTFMDMGVKLPLITRLLMSVSAFAAAYWYLILLFPVLVFMSFKALKRQQKTRYYVDLMKIKLPIINLVVYNKLLALFSEQLRILIVAGLPIIRSFDIITEVIDSEVFKRAISAAKEDIVSGNRIADALRKHKVFPSLVVRMVDIGETSGNLDDQFAFLSDYYFKRLDDVSQKMGKIIEPVLIAVIGTMFAVIIISLMLPVYDMISTLGRQ